jgi:hypothetical protein
MAKQTKGRTMKTHIVTLLVVLAAALATASTATAGPITFQTTGFPGPWLGSSSPAGGFDIYCQGTFPIAGAPPYTRFFVLNPQSIGRSPHPSYLKYSQDIYMGTQLYWLDSGGAHAYGSTRWQTRGAVNPNAPATFGQESFDVTAYPNVQWFVRTKFYWYVAGTSTLLGTAVDGYNLIQTAYNVWLFNLSTGERGCQFP